MHLSIVQFSLVFVVVLHNSVPRLFELYTIWMLNGSLRLTCGGSYVFLYGILGYAFFLYQVVAGFFCLSASEFDQVQCDMMEEKSLISDSMVTVRPESIFM